MTTQPIARGGPLDPDDIHVWWCDLRMSRPASVELAGRVLSPDERERAARFVRAADRRRFILAPGMLRHVLAAYAGRRPDAIAFEYLPHGKPRIAGPPRALEFNLSHSNDIVVCACANGREVGVDVEWLRPITNLAGVASVAF